ncbi:MAG: divergent PAP2 family protein [Candidatus Moranbacteria bacterium]|nr:divergent PAP2 family protein [Candidatus Moranbacteria bacterium]
MLPFITSHAVFVIPIAVGIIVQTIKFIIYSLKHGWDVHYIFTHGHMPSAHTAFAISIITSVGYFEGINDGSFAVAIALAFLIIDDATRLRMHLGDQGRYLNMLIEQLNIDTDKYPRLKERTGHRISEVIVGALLGFLLTVLFIQLFR